MHLNEAFAKERLPKSGYQFRCVCRSCIWVPAATIEAMLNRLNPVQPIMLIAKVLLFLLLLGFAALNSDSVTLRYFLGLTWQAPLSLVILVAFAIGLLAGFLGCSLRLLRNQRDIRALQRQLDKLSDKHCDKP
jgi:putative membrane protein